MSVVLIAGPTASGKSSAAIGVAEKRNGVIINADSMQVYRELKVLTARPTPADEDKVEHRLYGYLLGSERCSVARWLKDAGREIENVLEAGKTPVVVGGTGLYFKALEFGLAPIPEISPEVRQALRQQLEEDGPADLYEQLSNLDEISARRLKPNDSQRIVRALEVVLSTGKTLAHFHDIAVQSGVLGDLEVEKLVLTPDRELLYQRINERFDQMIAQGAVEEVKNLLDLKLKNDLPVMKAIGVRSISGHLKNHYNLDEAVRIAKQESRNYAKRQITWQRNQMADWQQAHDLTR